MFNNIMKKIMSMKSNRDSFDPSSLNDPVAIQTSWTPAKKSGTNIRAHKLVVIDSIRLEFRASITVKILCLILPLIGALMLIGFSYSILFFREFSINDGRNFILLFGLFFSGVGGVIFYLCTEPIVFDKRIGYFWKGRKAPNEVIDQRSLKHCAELEYIHALQLISEYRTAHNGRSYYSYELNLVFKDGKRINLAEHGNKEKLYNDARMLSDFLNKPYWYAM